MAQQRFALEWDRPFLPNASTHVSLFDGGKDPLHVVASGHGGGDANALSDLLTALKERNESADAIAFVSGEVLGPHRKGPCALRVLISAYRRRVDDEGRITMTHDGDPT